MPESYILKPGDQVAGKFEVTKSLGKGSLGEELYLGTHLKLERDVTIRVLPENIAADKELLERFFQAIRLTAVLQHPNILPAFEAGDDNGLYYLITGSEKGFFLNEYLDQRGKIDESEALRLVIALSEALEYAWEKHKILHRNIRPETILIAKGNEPMLTDFGMAKSLTDNKELTMTGFTVGNPQYMSPEQVQARQDLDFRSDMYCLGLVFYQMLVGTPPFCHGSQLELMSAQVGQAHAPVRDMNPIVSVACSSLIDKMLSKDRTQRHQSWEVLIKDLKTVMEKKSIPSARAVEPAHKITTRKPFPAGGNEQSPTNPPIVKNPLPVPLVVVSLLVVVIAVLIAAIMLIHHNNGVQKELKEKEVLKLKLAEDQREQERREQQKRENDKKIAEEAAARTRELEQSECWDKIVKYTSETIENDGDYDSAISRIEDVRKTLDGAKYEALIKIELDKVKLAKQKAIGKVVSMLAVSAKPFIAAKECQKALDLYNNYSGRFTAETANIREKAAAEIAVKMKEFENEKQKADDTGRKRRDEFLTGIAAELLKGNMDEACEKFKEFDDKASLLDAEKILSELAKADEAILETYKSEIGREIVLDLKEGGKEVKGAAYKIAKVEGGKIYMTQKVGKATIGKNVLPRDLPPAERIARLRQAKLSKSTVAIYAGVLAFNAKQPEKALEAFKEAGPLSEALRRQVEQSK